MNNLQKHLNLIYASTKVLCGKTSEIIDYSIMTVDSISAYHNKLILNLIEDICYKRLNDRIINCSLAFDSINYLNLNKIVFL